MKSTRTELYVHREQVYGKITTTDPEFDFVRHTGTSIGLQKEIINSEEISSDRQMSCARHGMKAVTGDLSFELSPKDMDDLLECALCGQWVSDVLKVDTWFYSNTFARRFKDFEGSSTTDSEWQFYKGCVINTMSIEVTPDSIVTGSFSVVGQDLEFADALPTGSIINYEEGVCPFNGFGGAVEIDGEDVGILTSVSFELANNVEPKPVIGSDVTAPPSLGKVNLTGTCSVYFDTDQYQKLFVDEFKTDIRFILTTEGYTYEFYFPQVLFSGGQPDTSADGEVMLELGFTALYYKDEDTSLMITRTIPAPPLQTKPVPKKTSDDK